jgi:MtN3 and saliva related transmembrane protein
MSPASLFPAVVAGLCTSTAAAPQIYQTYRTRQGAGLSYATLLLTLLGVGLWILYGLVLGLLPVVLWNGLSFLMFATLLVLKRYHCVDGRCSSAP